MNRLLLIGSIMLLLLSLLASTLRVGVSPARAAPGQRTGDSPIANLYCRLYLQDLAGRLNISVDTLERYKLAAEEDVLARLVSDHKMTSLQAEAMRAKLRANAATARCD